MVYNRIPVTFDQLPRITAPYINYQYDVVQILVINGLDLPDYYTVDFCNVGDAQTITVTGTPDGVRIPNDLLLTGLDIKAYIILTGIDEGAVETRYEVTIPVRNRPMRQGVEPTPEERLEIETLVNALNDGVERAEDAATDAETQADRAETAADNAQSAVEHYPKIEDGYWYVWLNGGWVNTGVKAEGVDGKGIVSVTGAKTSTSGLVDTYTLTVTYTDSTTDSITFTVTNGRDGTDGTDGVSPGVTITDITGGHRVTITDKDHPTGQSFDVLDGEITQAELDAAVTLLNQQITELDDVTFPDNLVGLEQGILYPIIPPIKVGEKFTVSVVNDGTLGRYVDYEWYDNTKTKISDKRLYAATKSQTTTVSGKDVHYFKWLQKPAKFVKVERGDTVTALTPYFKPFIEYAQGLASTNKLYKQFIAYPDSFQQHYYVDGSGVFSGVNTNFNTTEPIWLNAGDVISYRLCGGTGDSVIATYDKTGAFISALVTGLGNSVMLEGAVTLAQDCYVVALHRWYNVQSQIAYFYVNDSISYRAKNGITWKDAEENTFVSAYGTLSGWEAHADAFSQLMIDVENTEGFMFITDSHFMSKTNGAWKPYAYEIFSYLEKLYYASACSFVLHGGDWLGTGEARANYMYKLSVIGGVFKSKFDKFALLVGNHETGNQSAGNQMFTKDTLTNTLMRAFPKNYYLFKARTFNMYCFDSWQSGSLTAYAKEQITWFCDALKEETSEHIVIAVHILYDDTTLTAFGNQLSLVAEAYNNRLTYTQDSVTWDFSDATGKVGFIVAGHNHADATGTVNNIPYIMTVNLTGYGNEANFDDLLLPLDLVKVDWDNAKLTAYRAVRGSTGTTREITILV